MIVFLDLEQRPKLGREAVFPTASGQACLKALADGKGEPRGLIRFVEFAKRQEGIEAVVERGPVAGKTGTECLKTILRSGRMRNGEAGGVEQFPDGHHDACVVVSGDRKSTRLNSSH